MHIIKTHEDLEMEQHESIDELDILHEIFNKPVKRKRTLIVKVLVFELDTNEQIREHKIDFFDDQQLAWFKNMALWATMNYKYVKIYNIKDAP